MNVLSNERERKLHLTIIDIELMHLILFISKVHLYTYVVNIYCLQPSYSEANYPKMYSRKCVFKSL